MNKRGSKLQKKLYRLMAICIIPMAMIIVTMVFIMQSFTHTYDLIVEDIIKANAYNMDFKDEMDYTMYIIVVDSDRAEQNVDIAKPEDMIKKARADFTDLYNKSDSDATRAQLDRILRSLDTLEDRVKEIVDDSKEVDAYAKNMDRLDRNIRIITGLFQEQVQQYISYQVTSLDELRVGIKQNLNISIVVFLVVFVAIIVFAVYTSWKIVKGIVDPVKELCEVATTVGTGDFEVRAQSENTDELAILGESFNEMVGRIGTLVEDVKIEQEKLRSIELQLLQEQINPHFLYNTLDTITWLSETGENEQVIAMVNALSDFFRTGLSNGKSIVTIKEEVKHVESYLSIQRFRYQDILEYEIDIPEDIEEAIIPKLTLQPIVENALYHGIKNKRGKGRIEIKGYQDGPYIILQVSDDGIGISKEKLKRLNDLIKEGADTKEEKGFGLRNVYERLHLTYEQSFDMELKSDGESGTEVILKIPHF